MLNRTVTDPDLQIRGEPGHPGPEIRGGGSQKNFLRPFGPQFSLKIREPSPGSDNAVRIVETDHSYFEERLSEKSTQSRKVLWVVLSSLFFKEI